MQEENTNPVIAQPEPTVQPPTNIPKKSFGRNEYGLIADPSLVSYVYTEQGLIDWRKMIKPEFLVPNKQVFENRKKPVPTSIEGLEDRELLILLGGIKELAQIRGYKAVNYKVTSPSPDYVVAVCSINWIPNFETEGQQITFSSIADASPNNTTLWTKNYLAAMAENRAFVRCVRNFLKINIVGQEEIGSIGKVSESGGEDASAMLLKETMEKYGVTFELVKDKLIQEQVEGADKFTCVEDIPRFKRFEITGRIKAKAAGKKQD